MYTEEKTQAPPKLIEPVTRYYISNILNQCHENRAKIYLFTLNAGVFLLFVLVTSIILYGCYRSKKTPEEIKKREIEDQKYILSKIRHYKRERENMVSRGMMTGLPVTTNAMQI